MPSRQSLVDRLAFLGPCEDAREWLAKQSSGLKAWRRCPRGDWMLWLLGQLVDREDIFEYSHVSPARRKFVDCALDIARTRPRSKRLAQEMDTLATLMRRYTKDPDCLAEFRKAHQANDTKRQQAERCRARFVRAVMWRIGLVALGSPADCIYTITDYPDSSQFEAADIVRKHYPRPPRIPKEKS